MLTRALLLEELRKSETAEEKIYRETTTALFQSLQQPLQDLYDKAMRVTSNLTAITAKAIQENPRVVKILRYCLAPVISQMRLGQLMGLGTTEGFEEQDQRPNDEQARWLAEWFTGSLDRNRFPWAEGPVTWSGSERAVAERYAKLWTVSLVSNQNTITKYRNQRKERQEKAIAALLDGMGLTFQPKLNPAPKGQNRPGSGGIHFPATSRNTPS